jgi:hypothetical protein
MMLPSSLRRFSIYCRPIILSQVKAAVGNRAIIVTFNLALALHIQGIEYSNCGKFQEARHSYLMAKRMYELTFKHIDPSTGISESFPANIAIKEVVVAAMYNNMAHIQTSLGHHNYHLYEEELVKVIFYLADKDRMRNKEWSPSQQQLFGSFLDNVFHLVIKPSIVAAAA